MFYKSSSSSSASSNPPYRTAHRRTNSKPLIELPPPPSSFQLRSNPFTSVQTPNFQLEEEQEQFLEPIHSSSTNTSSLKLDLTHSKPTQLCRLGFHSTINFWLWWFSSIFSSIFQRIIKLKFDEEILFKLVFFFSFLAFIFPLAGIGYQHHPLIPHTNVLSAVSLPLHPSPPSSSSSSPPPPPKTKQADPFPSLHLNPISTKDIGPLFSNILVTSSSRSQPRSSYKFSNSVPDSKLRQWGLRKPQIESLDHQGKPDLLKISSPIKLKEDDISLDPLKILPDHRSSDSLIQVLSTTHSSILDSSSDKEESLGKLMDRSDSQISLDQKLVDKLDSEFNSHVLSRSPDSRLEDIEEEQQKKIMKFDGVSSSSNGTPKEEETTTSGKIIDISSGNSPSNINPSSGGPENENESENERFQNSGFFYEGKEDDDFEEQDPEISDDEDDDDDSSDFHDEVNFEEPILELTNHQSHPTFVLGNGDKEEGNQEEEEEKKLMDLTKFQSEKESSNLTLRLQEESDDSTNFKVKKETGMVDSKMKMKEEEEEGSMITQGGWKIKELESSIIQARLVDHHHQKHQQYQPYQEYQQKQEQRQKSNLFPDPQLVEVISGRKGLRIRHF